MTSTIDPDSSAQQEVHKHPVRGAIWGFFLGLGIAIYLVLFAVIAFGDWVPFGLCIAAGIVLGIVWASFAPAKQPKEPPPRPVATAATAATQPTVPAPPAAPAAPSDSDRLVTDDDTPSGGRLEAALDDLGVEPAAPPTDDLPPPPPPPTANG